MHVSTPQRRKNKPISGGVERFFFHTAAAVENADKTFAKLRFGMFLEKSCPETKRCFTVRYVLENEKEGCFPPHSGMGMVLQG
ncbi:MAG: hypothetical protein DRP66_08110 [Planctomycetota bacterium]|nr:MAG: hypothetical protein DRP66_08110 [Planctomycetota bacterium]